MSDIKLIDGFKPMAYLTMDTGYTLYKANVFELSATCGVCGYEGKFLIECPTCKTYYTYNEFSVMRSC